MADSSAKSSDSNQTASFSRDAAPIVDLKKISKRFGGVQALREVDFSIRAGEIHCLAGENGCGKSTLIKILSGVLAPDSGQIVLASAVHARLTPAISQSAGMQIIYQDLSLFPNLTVAENIAFQRNVKSVWRLKNSRAIHAEAAAVMRRLGIALPLEKRVCELPIASRQLVAICRTLASDARMIVMDEPTASLTAREADALLEIIRGLKSQGIATVLVSHRLDDMMAVGERVTVLRDGQNLGTFNLGEIGRDRLGELISGGVRSKRRKPPFARKIDPVLNVTALSRAGQFSGVDLTVRPGEIVGLIGRLGSGRTELALSLFGINPPDTGEVAIAGQTTDFKNNRDAIRAGVAYVSEDRLSLGLIMPQSIAENTIVAVLQRLCGRVGLIEPRRREQTISHWIDRLQIKTSTAERPVRELSGGNQQRVVLAKWLATEPRILILDSPTAGIDVGAKAGLYRTIDELAERGLGILLISDEVEEVIQQAHRILVMLNGEITAEFAADDVTENQLRSALHA